MVIGILSDTHGHCEPLRKAMTVFDGEGVEHFFHCGDVCAQDVFNEFIGRDLTFVWGNCDMPDGPTLAYLQEIGIQPPHEVPTRRKLDGKQIAVFHGHERAFGRATSMAGVDYILHGHTHEMRDERVGDCRIINPGALHRAATYTVATLDLATDDLKFHTIR